MHYPKENLISILINQIARLYTKRILSYECLYDAVQIIASKINWSYLRGE